MTFNEKINIENDIVKYSIQAKYNEELTDDEFIEIESLHDYVRKIKFAEIDFTANVTIINGEPVVTESELGDNIVEISLGKLTPKEYVLDENTSISFSVDANRIADSELNETIPTKRLMSQAKIAVFQKKIKENIFNILSEIRNENNNFEKDSEIIL